MHRFKLCHDRDEAPGPTKLYPLRSWPIRCTVDPQLIYPKHSTSPTYTLRRIYIRGYLHKYSCQSNDRAYEIWQCYKNIYFLLGRLYTDWVVALFTWSSPDIVSNNSYSCKGWDFNNWDCGSLYKPWLYCSSSTDDCWSLPLHCCCTKGLIYNGSFCYFPTNVHTDIFLQSNIRICWYMCVCGWRYSGCVQHSNRQLWVLVNWYVELSCWNIWALNNRNCWTPVRFVHFDNLVGWSLSYGANYS